MSPTSAEYSLWLESAPPPGVYTFTVTDPDGNSGSAVDTLVVNSLDAPDEDSFTPSLKNPTAKTITATFDNVEVNGVPYDDFNSYTSIDDLDYKKWKAGPKNATILSQKLSVTIDDVVGRGSGGLFFADPDSVNSIQADITVPSSAWTPAAEPEYPAIFLTMGPVMYSQRFT